MPTQGGPTPTVRGAAAGDAAAIGEAHAEAWRAAYGRDPHARLDPDLEPRLRDGSTLLVVEVDGRVVGFSHSGPGPAGAPEVFALYVHPDWWGTGAAQALWAGTVAALPEGRPVLWTLAGAGRARAFYEKQGWVPTGRTREHDFGVGEDVTVVEHGAP